MRKLLPLLAAVALPFAPALAQRADSVAGHHLYFNGSSNYADTRFTEHLPIFTVSAWVRSPNPPGSNQGKGPVHYEKNFQFNWDHVSAGARGAVVIQDSAGSWQAASFGPLEADTWIHLAATYDGDTLKAYRDGKLITANPATRGPAKQETNSLKLGRHALLDNPTYHFHNGSVDEVRVYNRVLTANEIRLSMHHPLRGNEAGLRLYMQMNESTPTTGMADSTLEVVSGKRVPLIGQPLRMVSTMPFGKGISQLGTASTGLTTFNAAGVRTLFYGLSRPVPLMVTRLETKIAGTQPDTAAGPMIKKPYWVMHAFDTASMDSAHIYLDMPFSDYNRLQSPPANKVKLLRRELGSDGNWAVADSAVGSVFTPSSGVRMQFARFGMGQLMMGKVIDHLVDTRPLVGKSLHASVWFNSGAQQFEISASQPNGNVQVLDLLGRPLAYGQLVDGKAQVSAAGLNTGIYLIRMEANGAARLVKVMRP